MKEPLVSCILKYALYAVFALGVVGVITLPFMLDTYIRFTDDMYFFQPDSHYRAFILFFLTAAALASLWVVLEMIFMLRSIPKGPFVRRNVRALNRCGVIFLVLAAAFCVKCVAFPTLLTVVCGLIFLGGGLFAFTLAALFRQAVVFREENDLTI